MKIILVRHGESKFNKLGRHQGGRYDSRLSEDGIKQAKKVARRLKDENIEAIYSSDLKRALETAKEIAKTHKLKVILDGRLREFNSGNAKKGFWESWKEYKTKEAERLKIKRHEVKAPGGESEGDHVRRVKSFIKELEEKEHKGTIVIVAHGVTNRMFFGASGSMEWEEVIEKVRVQENTCINEFDYNPKNKKWKVSKINCTRHLK